MHQDVGNHQPTWQPKQENEQSIPPKEEEEEARIRVEEMCEKKATQLLRDKVHTFSPSGLRRCVQQSAAFV